MEQNKNLGKDQDQKQRRSDSQQDLNKQQTSTTRTNEEKLKGNTSGNPSRLHEDDKTGKAGKSGTSR